MQAVDLSTSETFQREIPHEYFTWLRENEPVHWQTPPQTQISPGNADLFDTEQRGFWAISRHSDVIKVSLDQELFSSEWGGSGGPWRGDADTVSGCESSTTTSSIPDRWTLPRNPWTRTTYTPRPTSCRSMSR